MGVYLRAGVWYVRWRDASGRIARKATDARNERDARRLLAEVSAQVERVNLGLDEAPAHSRETLRELLAWWLKERCPEPSRATEGLRVKKHVIRQLGHLKLAQVTPDVLERRFEQLAEEGAAAASINRLRTTLHAAFSAAMLPPRRWAGRNPVASTRARPVKRGHHITIAPELLPVVLAWTPDTWRGTMAVAAYLGLRKGEIFALKRSDWDRQANTLRVAASHQRGTTKGDRIDVLPVPPVLEPYLRAAWEWRPKTKQGGVSVISPWLFPDRHGNQRKATSDPHLVLRSAAALAGIADHWETWCRKCVELGRVVVHERHQSRPVGLTCPRHERPPLLWVHAEHAAIKFHDLRHSCATNLLRAGVPLAHVQRILRHASIRTTVDVYGHLDVDDLRSSVAAPTVQLSQRAHAVAEKRSTNEAQPEKKP